MRDAVAEDFGRIPGVEVVTVNEVCPEEEEAAVKRAAAADFAIVIAPEFDHLLETRYRWIKPGVRMLIGPRIDGLRASTDKLATAEIWTRNSVPTPRTYADADWPCESFPIVCKPQSGAGSIGVCLIRSRGDLARIREVVDEYKDATLYQTFVPGRPASVAYLIGQTQTIPLLPAFQQLSDDGRFRYLGGELPIPPSLADRAIRLGRRAVECVPGLAGYVGVDLVLGDARGRLAGLRHRDQPPADHLLRRAAGAGRFQYRRSDAQPGRGSAAAGNPLAAGTGAVRPGRKCGPRPDCRGRPGIARGIPGIRLSFSESRAYTSKVRRGGPAGIGRHRTECWRLASRLADLL